MDGGGGDGGDDHGDDDHGDDDDNEENSHDDVSGGQEHEFGKNGTKMLTKHEELIVDTNSFILEESKWYHVILELYKDEFLFRIQEASDGTVHQLYAKHLEIGKEYSDYSFSFTGKNKGYIYVDNFEMWTVEGVSKEWNKKKKLNMK